MELSAVGESVFAAESIMKRRIRRVRAASSTHTLRLRASLRNRLFSCGGGQCRHNLNVWRICRFCRVAGNISSNGRAGLRSEYNNGGRGGQRSILAARTTAARQPGRGRLADVSSFPFGPWASRYSLILCPSACVRVSVLVILWPAGMSQSPL